MLAQSAIQLLIANAINNTGNGTYIAPTFAGFAVPYTSGHYYSAHHFTTAGYYFSNQAWGGPSSVVMRGDPIMVKNEYGRNDISTGAGNDVIYSATGNYLQGSGHEGHDLIIAHNQLDGRGDEGDDFIVAGVDIVSNAGGNYLTAWKNQLANAQSMSESELASKFTYRHSNNTISGGDGNDFIVVPGNGNNTIYGDEKEQTSGDGNDLIIVGNGDNKIYGGGGNDNIYVGSGVNEIYGGSGDDILYTDSIMKEYDGGAGFDVCSFALKNSAIVVDGSFWGNTSSVEGVVGTVYADTISGTIADNILDGYSGNDILNGGLGNDTLIGGDGNDTLNGGDENDSLNGGTGNDILNGNTGNDTIWGGAGHDDLIGGAGIDHLLGGAGDDYYKFGIGSEEDYVYENPNEGTDFAYLQGVTNFGLYKHGNNLWVAASNNDIMVLADWYLNGAVEYLYLEATNQYGALADLAQFAQDITPQATASAGMFRASANAPQDIPDYLDPNIQLTHEVIEAVALAGMDMPAPLELA